MGCNKIMGFVLLALVFHLTACTAESAAVPNDVVVKKVRIVLVGDSTVTDEKGWGLGFKRFVTDRAECVNTAASGRSSKSFINEGRWARALALKGDYYLIQFGHNDQPGKGPDRETDPNTTYRAFMARYVDEARAMGAKPILVTSLVRRHWDKSGSGKINSTLVPYVAVVKKLAAEKDVPLVDLHARSKELCERLGKEKCRQFSPIKDTGKVDNTHLNAEGSVLFARLVVEELIRAVPELKSCFRSEPSPDATDVKVTTVQKAVDECGKAAGGSGTTQQDVWKPSPQNGTSNVTADTVVLSWSPVPEASTYSVYIGEAPDKLTLASKVDRPRYKSDILKVFTDYYWQVTAHKRSEEKEVLSKSSVWRFKTAQKAFPSAEGFGKFTPGGRGGKVIKVTNLNDSGPGSLRAALETVGPRIIVFDVSGNIMLKSPLIVTEPYVTVAGQTAPGDGVAVVGNQTSVATHDAVVRFMRFRGTDLSGEPIDALNNSCEQGKGTRFIFDHCTASWGVDETLSATYECVCTVQWCLVSENLWRSVHPKGPHGYGGIWGGDASSFHHNLLAHHTSRLPRFDGGIHNGNCLIDHRNNVIYNWGYNSAYGAEDDRVNMVNNYYKAGPATKKTCANRIYEAEDPNTRMYVNGNYVDGFPEITKDNWAGGIHYKKGGKATEKTLRVYMPFEVVSVPTTSAEQAYEEVLAKVGAVFPARDSLDERIINEVRTGTATYGVKGDGIIDSQFDLCPQKGKCPRCVKGDYCWLPKLKSGQVPEDTDDDGMPDSWEREKNLDPADASDASKDRNSDGYTNIEEYINLLVKDV